LKIGFIGFGEVASTLAKSFKSEGLEVYTCLEGRSPKTVESAQSSSVNICPSFNQLADISDIILAAVVPAQAVNVAKIIGKNFEGLYVDLNNVSPSTVKEALQQISKGKTVDAAIMGSVARGLSVPIIASGKHARDFAELNSLGMNIEVVGNEIGQASAVKMLRSAYTKGVSALLFESLYAAYQMKIDDLVLKYLAETEGPNFTESATSRIKNSIVHGERRTQEIEEVLNFLSEYEDPLMTQATLSFFKVIVDQVGPSEKKPDDYRELFRKFSEKRNSIHKKNLSDK
jgi:3-hydroxyisobutyrate dehydrogenase-like beta-hydroxyacid dehydrogenase